MGRPCDIFVGLPPERSIMRTILAGNWKMHKDRMEAMALIDALVAGSKEDGASVEMIIAPPFPFLDMAVQRTTNAGVQVAAQTCHEAEQGAFTGEVSARMLASTGVRYVIIGHSE